VILRRSGLGVVLLLALGVPATARAADPWAWVPRDAPALAAGHAVAGRFQLAGLVELTVEVDNAFSATNRAALATVEQRLAALPGVRRVLGPAALLDVRVDASGKPGARSVFARGTSESDGEAVRQRVVRRADALGWFVSANGRLVRFYVDAEDPARLRAQIASGEIEEALRTAGLALSPAPVDDGLGLRALLPDARAGRARWLPAAFAAGWVLFVALLGFKARPFSGRLGRGGRLGIALGVGLGAAAPFVMVPVGGVRLIGLAAAGAAGLAVLLAMAIERARGPRPGGWTRFARPPALVLVLALGAVAAFVVFAPRLRVGTHQWSEAPLAFVDVRGDFDQPAVLRELGRLTELLRAQPGVEGAWSIADLFMGVEVAGEEASHIPWDAESVRQILVQARRDPAVALELSADHREALVVVRFDAEGEGPADRLDLAQRLSAFLRDDLRPWLVSVDLREPALPAVARGVAKGLLASDTALRVVSIAARSGRPLTAGEARAVERAARQAASIPTADPGRLAGELTAEARDFVQRYPVPLHQGEQARLVGALAALPDESRASDVAPLLAEAYGDRVSERVLADSAAILARRLAAVRWRHTARINFREMLYGADLPTEGVLADEVRSATLEGMGPVTGIPVAPETPSALRLEAIGVGGAAHDRALSEAWEEGLRRAAVGLVIAWGILLALVGGARGLAWLPVGLAPAAVALLAPTVIREPLGLWNLSFAAGALAAGGTIAFAFAARRFK
jgi:hypothetical protein